MKHHGEVVYIPLEEQDTYVEARKAVGNEVTLVNLTDSKGHRITDKILEVHEIATDATHNVTGARLAYFVETFAGAMPLLSSIWKLVPIIELDDLEEEDK